MTVITSSIIIKDNIKITYKPLYTDNYIQMKKKHFHIK